MPEAPDTLEGWFSLHLFLNVDRTRTHAMAPADQAALADAARVLLGDLCAGDGDAGGSTAAYRVLGHKADTLLIFLRPTMEALGQVEDAIAASPVAEVAASEYSYLSVTELSLYEASARGGTTDPAVLLQMPHVRNRLFPKIPDTRYASFYPMNKRRGETVNWYAADLEERRRMMREHGSTGKKYRGLVTQVITGSVGLDDWEWGVTLFSDDAVAIKQLVYEMRFDEVSARYAEFGPFRFGVRLTAAEFGALIAR